jgi:hypothetical protein
VRFELTTPGITTRCSNQLSYGHTKEHEEMAPAICQPLWGASVGSASAVLLDLRQAFAFTIMGASCFGLPPGRTRSPGLPTTGVTPPSSPRASCSPRRPHSATAGSSRGQVALMMVLPEQVHHGASSLPIRALRTARSDDHPRSRPRAGIRHLHCRCCSLESRVGIEPDVTCVKGRCPDHWTNATKLVAESGLEPPTRGI